MLQAQPAPGGSDARLLPPLSTPLSTFAGQGHEANRENDPLQHRAICRFLDEQQFLSCLLRPHRDYHLAARLQLLHQRRWNECRRSGDYDAVEGSLFGPSLIVVADAYVDIAVTSRGQSRCCRAPGARRSQLNSTRLTTSASTAA